MVRLPIMSALRNNVPLESSESYTKLLLRTESGRPQEFLYIEYFRGIGDHKVHFSYICVTIALDILV